MDEMKLEISNVNKLKTDCKNWRISEGKFTNRINGNVNLNINKCFAKTETIVCIFLELFAVSFCFVACCFPCIMCVKACGPLNNILVIAVG